MSRLNINRLTNENEDGAPKISGITTFSSNAFLEAPKGSTAQRPENVAPGMIRFNTDSGHLEYFTGDLWDEVLVANNTLDGGNRAVFASKFIGGPLPYSNVIEYATISTLGNVQDFGDLTGQTADSSGMSSSTRGVFAGGYSDLPMNYITISSTGNAQTFGTLNNLKRICDGRASSSTRGIMFGSLIFSPAFGAINNSIEYITFSSTGNSVEFGDMSTNNAALGGGMQSSTRGVVAGTYNPTTNVIQYVTMSTTGNTQDFGDLSFARNSMGGLSNSTRGVLGGGFDVAGTNVNTIDFITIASIGNSQDFGDLSSGGRSSISGTSSPTRGLFSATTPGNAIEYIAISTTGNTQDFGDLTLGGSRIGSLSNGHGGL
jgi:hypothetical protein